MPNPPRVMEIHTPLGDDVLLLRSMSAKEALGEPFEYSISALSSDRNINLDQLLGSPITVKLEMVEAGGDPREFSGIVTRFAHTGFVGRLHEYQLTVNPWLWLLTRSNNIRIFQNKTVPEIIKAVFEPYSPDFRDSLSGTFEQRDYCVQYRESDFNFVSRLMEEEGIYYFFEHKNNKHTLVLANQANVHQVFQGISSLPFRETLAGGIDMEAVTRWQFDHSMRTGKVTLTDFFYESPQNAHAANSHTQTLPTSLKTTGEYYDYNVGMGPNHVPDGESSKIQKRTDIRQHYAELKAREFEAQYSRIHAESNARGIVTGSRFSLTDFPRDDQNAEHVVVSTAISMGFGEYEGQSGSAPYYNCQFTAIKSSTQFVPVQRTPKPVVGGPQTAIVVGPSGQEIYTDALGRVKVQFHWDRHGESNENSSCWARVASPWAGKGWGMISLPRIGQEVVIDFLEGDPDLPIITGRIYNSTQTPPYTLPDHATVSTIKSRSSQDGAPDNFNELRFEDKKGDEYIWLQAEKDFKRLVKNDSFHSVGNDEHVSIKNDRKEKIGNDQHLEIVNDFKQKVGGDMHLQTGTDLMVKVGGQYSLKSSSDYAVEAGAGVSFKASSEVQIKGGSNVTIEAGSMLTLKAGGSTIVLGPSGVSIVGTMVNVNSGGGGSGASPVAPAAPADPAEPTEPEDPLAS